MKLQKEHNKMRDRFDLEQDIMQCWGIIDDLKMLIEQDAVNKTTAEALTVLYNARFQHAWTTFEECCTRRNFTAADDTAEAEEEYARSQEIDNSWAG